MPVVPGDTENRQQIAQTSTRFRSGERLKRYYSKAAAEALDRLEVDVLGLDLIDRRLLEAIAVKFSGGPVGLDTLAAVIGEDPGTIGEVYEPYLLQLGFIQRTPRGRVATARAYEHLGLEAPQAAAAREEEQV